MRFKNSNDQEQLGPKLERRQLPLIRKIYSLKIWLILLILLLSTIVFYIVSVWSSGKIPPQLAWLHFIPWVSLATTTLGVVVVGFAYEWIVRDEAEQKLNQVLEQHFQSQADNIRKLIPTAIFTTPDLMRLILTAESVDAAILASLEVRLRDRQLAKDVYDNLFSQLLISEDRRSNYKCKVSLTTIKNATIADEIKQTYYEARLCTKSLNSRQQRPAGQG